MPTRAHGLTTFCALTGLILSACETGTGDDVGDGATDPRQPTWGDPNAPPLSVSTAAAPLCSGAGSRQSDGSGGGAGRDDEGAAGPNGSGAGGTGAGGYSASGGSGGDWAPWYDAGTALPDAASPPIDAGDAGDAAPCDGACADASTEDAGEARDGTLVQLDARSTPPIDALPPAPATASRAQPVEAAPTCPGIDLETPRVLYMSADDSNSMAAPVIARRIIGGGAPSVPAALVRPWEFLNYYRFEFDRPAAGDLNVSAKLGSCDLTQDFALQIAVQAEAPSAARAPMHFVLVLDTSGSMDGKPLRLEQAAVRALAGSMRAGDRVSAVTWSVDQRVLLNGRLVEGPDDPEVLAVADGLAAGGGTDLEGGLSAGYALAEQFREREVLERVVLISDGQANVGITSEALIGAAAEDEDGEGTYLVGVGVGDGVNDTLMDTVTDAGRGAYVYLDSEAEAARVFGERFAETVLVAARAVRIQVTLPPYFNVQKFYGEVYSPDPRKVRPQHLGVDDAMVLQQIIRPCNPELPRETDELAVEVTWQDPVSGIARQKRFVRALGDLDVADPRLTKAAVVIGYAEALQVSEALPPAGRLEVFGTARRHLRDFDATLADPDLAEIDRLLGALIGANGGAE